MEAFRELFHQFVTATAGERDCLCYGFGFNGEGVHCREGYVGAECLLTHLDNVGALLNEALKIPVLTCVEIHGIQAELDKLRKPLPYLNAAYFTLESGFLR